MMHFLKNLSLSLILVLTATLNSWAISYNVQELVDYETLKNAVAIRSNNVVNIQHYDIPLEYVEKDLAARLAPEIRDALIHNKNGVPHVRWIINPEDTIWHLEVEEFLRRKGLSTQRHSHFLGYMTASRSYIIEDINTGAEFSAKVSTNKTGGNWTDKKQELKDAQEIRNAADYVHDEVRKRPFEHVIAMDEPAMFGIKSIDQAMVIRELTGLTNSNNKYLPGFSAVHTTEGRAIALQNNSNNPAEFWNTHYNKPLARAIAELAARTGLTYDSPHSQNFLVELDANYKPTGKIVMRDFGDAYLLAEIPTAKGYKKLVDNWLPKNLHRGKMQASIGILHGNTPPTWLPDQKYNQWGNDFYREFFKELSKQTNISVEKLTAPHTRSGLYFTTNVNTRSVEWQAYFNKLKQERLAIVPLIIEAVIEEVKIKICRALFAGM